MADTIIQPAAAAPAGNSQWLLFGAVAIGGFFLWANRDKIAGKVDPVQDMTPPNWWLKQQGQATTPTKIADNSALRQKLQSQIAGLQVQLTAANAMLTNIGAETPTNHDQRVKVQARITAIGTKIAALQAQINALA